MADRSVTVPQLAELPLIVAEAAWMMSLLPLERRQTAVARLPSADSPEQLQEVASLALALMLRRPADRSENVVVFRRFKPSAAAARP